MTTTTPIEISATCGICRLEFRLTVDRDRYSRWKNGEGHIQHMLPELSEDDRELLVSGTCGRCFDAMFAESESEDGE